MAVKLGLVVSIAAAALGVWIFPAPAGAVPSASFDHELGLARASLLAAKPQEAYNHARTAIEIGDQHIGAAPAPAQLASAEWLSGEALTRLKQPGQALPLLDHALAAMLRNAPDTSLTADILKSRGRAEASSGKFAAALEDFQRAFPIFQHANNKRGAASALQEVGSIYMGARDYPHVLKYYEESKEVLSTDPILNLSAENNRGVALMGMGRYQEAELAFRKALQTATQMQSGYLRAQILSTIAYVDTLEGHPMVAKADVSRGLALVAQDPEAYGERPFLEAVLAKIAADSGDYKSAGRLVDQVFFGVDLTKTTPPWRDFHENAAQIYEHIGATDKALKQFKAFKRLDDDGRDLAASTNSALMNAQFDFANQNTKIAKLKAGELQRDVMLAQAKARSTATITGIVLLSGLLSMLLMLHALVSMQRSRNQIRSVNQELETTNGALEKALKAKSEFLAMTSHEIRTPLNGILGMTEVMLSERTVVGETRSRLEVVQAAGVTMNALVTDLLDIAKMETGHLTIERSPVDLRALLGEVERMWADKARMKGIQFKLDLNNCPGEVIEDGSRLRQILFNLAANAIKFTDQGEVCLSVDIVESANDTKIIYTVSDTGIGIPANQFDRIFDSFTQVDGGRSRHFGGTGLGLAICQNLVKALGGDITLKSTVGVGSDFRVELPLIRPEVRESAGGDMGSGLDRSAVLVLEDNPLAQSMMRAALGSHIRRLEFVSSISDLSDADRSGYDVILVDGACLRKQVGADPFAAIATVRRSVSALLVVLWPAMSQEDAATLFSLGADLCLSKPITSAALFAALESAVSGKIGNLDHSSTAAA